MAAFDELVTGMPAGREWALMGDSEGVRALLGRVYDERCHGAQHYKSAYQPRVNLQEKDDAASYAGWITSENPTSGPYQVELIVVWSGLVAKTREGRCWAGSAPAMRWESA